ncbi:ArnT family glycosyltransferase [Kitasatospora sp. LaBMicrA B282]|uniref:ArnT family glycosyltransferase n=1 Tax=Kitasatospora sp. LaBMicrA B282 TaxID=3420949 RepID=UPI003D13DA57
MQSSRGAAEPSAPVNAEPDRSAERPDSPRARLAALAGRPGIWPLALVLGYVAQVAFRLSLVTGQNYPVVHPDEDMYLTIARLFAGRGITEIPSQQVIPGGYPLLISPALRLTSDPVYAYHLVLGINALISCLVLPLAYWGLRRLEVSRPLSYVFAMAAAVLPPVVFYSQYAMADTALPPLFLAWLIGLHGLLSDGSKRRRIWFGLLTGLAGGYTMVVHDRGQVVVAVTIVVLLAVLVLRWAPWMATAVALAATGAMVALKQETLSWLLAHSDGSQPSAVGNAVFDTLKQSSLLHRTLMRMFGHLWYLVTSTWGIAAMVLLVCVISVFNSKRSRADRVVAFVLVAMTGGIALAAAAGLPNDHRIDTIVYARYLSPLVPVFFVVGTAVFVRLQDRRKMLYLAAATVVSTLALTELVVHMAGKQFHTGYFIVWGLPDATFLSTLWTGGKWTSFHAALTALVALIVFAVAVLVRVAGGRRTALAAGAVGVGLAVFAACATVSITDNLVKPNTSWRAGDATQFLKAASISTSDDVVMDVGFSWEKRMTMGYELISGRVWTISLQQPAVVPAQAKVAVVMFWAKDAPADKSWPNAPQGWHVTKADAQDGYAVWKRDQ